MAATPAEARAELVRSPRALSRSQAPASDSPTVVFVLGGPGAGKGTQCVNLVRSFAARSRRS